MKIDFFTVFRLTTATLLPVVLAVVLYYAERKTSFLKIKYRVRQVIVGVLFGGVAVLATEFGIPVDGAVLNVRNAAPLTAGLVFGGPAGIIAGGIGGVYRWLAVFWGAGEFSKIACSLACVLAGLFGAGCRKFMFDNKKASWFYGLAIGVTTEVLHMLLLFVTNLNDVYTAFGIVAKCAAPMIICNGVSVMLSLLFISLMGKERVKKSARSHQLSQIFQLLLLICVIVAFAATTFFTYSFQTRIAYANADSLLELNLEDVKNDVREASDENLLHITKTVAERVTLSSSREELQALAEQYNVAGINLVDQSGIITESTLAKFVGFDMSSGEQSAEFLCLLNGKSAYVQEYQPLSIDGGISRKYAGVSLSGGGFVQVGYDAEQFQKDIAEEIRLAVRNRHIGRDGGVIVCDGAYKIVSDNGGNEGQTAIEKSDAKLLRAEEGKRFITAIRGTESCCMYSVSEGFYLIATLPVAEATFSRNIAVCILMFMEIIVFAALFAHIYFLIKRLIVDNIHKINGSLAQISGGNLNVLVNVRENEEFASLSDDINATVDTLKHYIAEAESRIDRELEFARQIQQSSLPSVFPPYPERKDFDIFASMHAAKEVGGDFYDFYLTDATHLAFLVADVSGKGIPGALFMMRAKTLMKNLAESGRSIDETFTEANRALCENNDAEMFVTTWMGRLDLSNGVLEYVNAGHNPPLVRRANGEVSYLKTRPNFILAGMDGTKYKKHEILLAPGDTIFLYTDGVTEAANTENRLYGEDRLLKILSCESGGPQALCEAVRADIGAFTGEAEQSDDITMLCVKLNPCSRQADLSVAADKSSIETVMNFFAETLEAWELPKKLMNKAQIAADEIFSNIVYYSGAKNARINITESGEKLSLLFEDDGVPYDPTAAKEPDVTLSADEREIGGLGIFLVRKTASEFKYENKDGKNLLTVVFDEKER